MIARRYRLHVSGSQMRQTEGPLLKMQVPRAPVHVLVQVSVRWAQEIVAEMASRPPCGKPCSGRTWNTQRSIKTTIGKAGQSADTPRAPDHARARLGMRGRQGGSRHRHSPHCPTVDSPEPERGAGDQLHLGRNKARLPDGTQGCALSLTRVNGNYMPKGAFAFPRGVESDHGAFWFHPSQAPSRASEGLSPLPSSTCGPSHSGSLPATPTIHRTPATHTLC